MNPLDWSLVDGWLWAVLTLLGPAAFAAILVSRRRIWWLRTVPVTVTTCTALVAGLVFAVDVLWRPFPEPLPPPVTVWVGLGILALSLAAIRGRSLAWRGRAGMALAAFAVWMTAVTQTNAYFSAYPTLRVALGMTVTVTPFDQVDGAASALLRAPAGGTLGDVWRPPPGMPERGTLSEVVIPSSRGFDARPAWVYLPPAYLAMPRAELPVLVLVAGQPGTPTHWIGLGQLSPIMDRFARENDGLAPVVVVPDHLGSTLANPLCLDSPLGNVETYLTVDVPAWIRRNLQVDEDPAAWAIGGLSQGGTCALQLAIRAPAVYPSFVYIAGQREPTIGGGRQRTVDRVFGGDEAAFARINPLDVLSRTSFAGTAGVIVAGQQDSRYKPDAYEVLQACRRAGMDMHLIEVPGGHDWAAWRTGLYTLLPWLADRLGLIR